jgi:drug/metabolite transporter (DMT)-like permease
MNGRDWAMLVLLSLLWGGAFFFYKVLDDAGLPPVTIVLSRVGMAALALVPVVRLSGLSLPSAPRDWLAYIPLAVANNLIPFFLFTWGETQIASGLAAILNATTPIFTAIVAHLVTADERFSTYKVAGIALGFAGIVALVGPDAIRGLNLASVAQLGCLAAAVSYAFAAVYGKRFRGTPPIVVSSGQLITSTVLVLPLELVLDKPWTFATPSTATWAAMLAMALLGTSAAYILYFQLIVSAGAVNASLVTLLVPVSALILGSVFLHEHVGWNAIAGMLLIFAGLAAMDGRIFGALRRTRPKARPRHWSLRANVWAGMRSSHSHRR